MNTLVVKVGNTELFVFSLNINYGCKQSKIVIHYKRVSVYFVKNF